MTYDSKTMTKNICKSVRINGDKLKLLEKNGQTLQQLVDWAVDQKISVQTTIKLKKK